MFKKIKKAVLLNSILVITPISIIATLFIYFFYSTPILKLFSKVKMRFSVMLEGVLGNESMGKSVEVRLDQFSFVVKSIFNNFSDFMFGHGIGSFGILYSGQDVRLYPHNFLLETWFELGLVGLILLIAFLFYVFFINFKKRRYISYFVLLYIFLNMMKSFSLIDIRIFFAFFAIFLFVDKSKKYMKRT